ncbi:hypothetical protein WL40_11530 [Burkholderia ubonensis]|uniref:Phage membrane protein n=1 Tax=Burkholderia ubonensis TaxID=101571 RepID=A0AAW3N3I8_9BURK|nr:hypothetical protein WJ41_04775 [Burkholderia ubonensis]KVO10210.1 hypothetical protein WJ69_19665 [Burkholderia ubonensis]KVO10250.1 hypothetical protein WJ73_00840 [Burkholderia ubonensis]KVO19909.1 hypothetical protein WJ74_05315 [Burkholderia ubonensis]KVO23612.1 hypothetical protein WJ72_31935 [Burkholderia ubonensis]
MSNTYTYGIHENLTPVELFFLIAVDETMNELGISDAVGVAMILAGSRFLSTRGKFAGAVKGTSAASKLSRSLLPYEIKHRILPTFTSWTSVVLLRVKMTNHIGVFVGRAIPGVGWMITAADVATIGYKTVLAYNRHVKPEDRL